MFRFQHLEKRIAKRIRVFAVVKPGYSKVDSRVIVGEVLSFLGQTILFVSHSLGRVED